MVRILKIALAGFVAFFCSMYAIQNLMNLQAAHDLVALMVGMEGHVVYPSHFGPSIQSPLIVWLTLGLIIALEITAGMLAVKGVLDLWKARSASAEDFNNAKSFAILGCGLAVIIWYGIFSAIGGAYFQMWQTEVGKGVWEGAFMYSMQSGLILLIINATDR